MIKILQIIILIIFALLMMSSSCDKGSEGCADPTACNYDDTAATDDGSCWFVSEHCDCGDPPGSVIDCLKICDANILNDPPVDSEGNCCTNFEGNCNQIVVGGCIEEQYCNFDSSATHNDGSCASNLEVFGGSSDGYDCEGTCAGEAVEDACGSCVGSESTISGKSWLMSINATAVFIDSTRVSDPAYIGASIYAENGYNNEIVVGTDYTDYFDIAELCVDHADSLCFYFPHDEWEGEIDTNFTNGYDFDRDIRGNDLHILITDGIDWEAEISSILSESILIDSLLLDFTFEQGLESCIITVKLDFGEEYNVQNNHLAIEVGSNEDIKLIFNISNVCFSDL